MHKDLNFVRWYYYSIVCSVKHLIKKTRHRDRSGSTAGRVLACPASGQLKFNSSDPIWFPSRRNT